MTTGPRKRQDSGACWLWPQASVPRRPRAYDRRAQGAFVQGQLTRDEFDERIAQALASRTYAELAVVTADIPGCLAGARPGGR